MAHIRARLTRGERHAFVVAGPPGVGKTRLAAEVAAGLAREGHPRAHAAATAAAASIPFGAFAPLLSDVDLSPAEGQLQFLQRASEAIVERHRGDRPLLLVVDDGHFLDDGSATLVHQLAHRRGCWLVVTLRAGVAAPDPITALWKDELAERLDLQPMTEEEVGQLTQAALGGPADGRAVRWLYQQSAGNPLFARELILGALHAGDLVERNGIWVLRSSASAPQRLVELIDARLSGLPSACSQVVDVLSIGEPLELTILGGLTSPEAVEEAESLDLVTLSRSDRRSEVSLIHPLFGEVRRRQMPRTRARRLSAALAQAVVDAGARRQGDILRIATWRLEAGETTDGGLFSQAASIARQRFARDLAARLARAALDAGAGIQETLAVAEAEFFGGNHEAAEKILSEAGPHCRSDTEVMLVANARAYNLAFLMNDKDRALSVVGDALPSIVDPAARLRLLIREATIQAYSGDLEMARASLSAAVASEDPDVRLRAAQMASITLALLGRYDDALATVRIGLDAQQHATGVSQMSSAQMIGSITARLGNGELQEAETEFRAIYAAVIDAGDNEAIATFALIGGMALVERGLLSEAATRLREGAAINEEIDDLGPLRWCLGGVAVAEGMAGRPDEAAAAIDQLDSLPGHWMTAYEPVLCDRGRAWAMVARGELTPARGVLRAAAAACVERSHRYSEAVLRHDLVRLGDAVAVVDRLTELAEMVGGEAIPLYAQHARGLARSDTADLESAAGGFQRIGALLLAAEAASEVAELYRTQALARQAANWARTAAELRAAIPDVRTPALKAAGGGPGERLTRREREIAELAASGASSKEMAERLFLSVRTVDSHLQRVYTKLGISKRDQIADALGGAT